MRGFNLDQLRTFVDVIELGSLSAAASRLNLSQPAISLQIRQLEKRLGVQLLERVGRRATATSAGIELLNQALKIESVVSSAMNEMSKYTSGAAGRVRLGTGATACAFLLPPILHELKRRLPDIDITVTTGNTRDVVKAIHDNRLDLGLVTMPVVGRGIEVISLFDDELVLIAPPEIALPRLITPSFVRGIPKILFEPGGNVRRIIDDWFAPRSLNAKLTPVKPVMSLGSVESIKRLVQAGVGCSILPRMAFQREKDREGLTLRRLSPKLYRKLAIVIRSDRPLKRGIKELIKGIDGKWDYRAG